MKTMQDVHKLKVGESMVIPWSNLPSPRPEKGAAFGNGEQCFIAEPKEDGLEIRGVTQAEVLEWKAKQ
jgi:hypothetical protein